MRFRRQDLRVESFEYVEVGEELALLRLAGEWRAEAPDGVRLLAEDEELPALPEPPGEGDGLWRAAYSVSSALLDGRTAFRLEAADGRSFELPAPVAHGVGVPTGPAADPPPLEEPDYEVRELADPVVEEPHTNGGPPPPAIDYEALEAAEQALHAERARHERTEASLREQLRVMVKETAEFMGRLEGYEARRAELEKELSWERLLHKESRRLKDDAERERDEALDRLGPVETALAQARHEVQASARAGRQLADARERITQLERQVEQQEELLRGAREMLDRGTGHLVELEQRLMELRDEAVAADQAESEALVASGEQALEVEAALEEAERGTERLAFLERRIGELREGIAEQDRTPPAGPDRPPARGPRRRRFLR